MRSLAGLLADGMLAGAILIPTRPLIPPTNIRKVRKGSPKKVWKPLTQKILTSK